MTRKCLACQQKFECEHRHNFVCERCKDNRAATRGDYIAEHAFKQQEQKPNYGIQ